MLTHLTTDRIKVLDLVIKGKLPASAMTMEELEFIEQRVYDLAEERHLTEAVDNGKIVFSGVVDGLMN